MPSTADVDITSIDVSYTHQTFSATAHIQNPASGDRLFALCLMSAPTGPLDPSTQTLAAGRSVSGGTPTVLTAYKAVGTNSGGSTTISGLNIVDNGTTVTVAFDGAAIPWSGPVYVGALYSEGGSEVAAGTSWDGANDLVGFGPILSDPIATSLSLTSTATSQKYGATPVTFVVTVSPLAAAGTVTIYDNGKALTALIPTNGQAVYTLPKTLKQGVHAITARFTPVDTVNYAVSPLAASTITVTGIKSTIKATLSKKKQHFKKSAAKVSVKVSKKLAGKVTIVDGTKKLKTISVKKGKGKASYVVSKKLTRGTHKLTVRFTPSIPKYAIETKKLTLKVVK